MCNEAHKLFRQNEYSTQSHIQNNLLSHSPLLLSAIIPFAPSQIPLLSAVTQLPLNIYFPFAQRAQLFELGPVHVLHDGEHTLHCAPLLKLPSGQAVPPGVTDCTGLHLVESLGFCVYPD